MYVSWKMPRSLVCVFPREYVYGKVLAHDVVNTDTGEVIAKANEVLTAASVEKLIEASITEVNTLYTNDLDRGAYISDTLGALTRPRRAWEALVEIYRMMRPGEPPTKDAAENLFGTCSSIRSAMTSRPSAHEVQPARRAEGNSRHRNSVRQTSTSAPHGREFQASGCQVR